ncbi:MAG: STAS domain-containing protein [Planctomycetes bacterium]|nr:STAS domain-containing protein [Planctomycetota bacterium]
MKMTIERFDDLMRLTLRGDFDAFVRDPFLERVASLIAEGARRLELDLLRVRFLGSSGAGALLKCRRMLREQGGELLVLRASDAVRETLELLDLTRLLGVADDELEPASHDG